ncbi:hypothetical protein Rmf_39380 [Roseomonas fluvialis]|uniref:Uncharacterized protein n=1 Tax=Roseomonas fluvialis TaxID=1750527 RepID=A0ABM7Y7Q5_9PROT|nr:hypothetical protein Rmf_39380 [Roseomonas fluvialis]
MDEIAVGFVPAAQPAGKNCKWLPGYTPNFTAQHDIIAAPAHGAQSARQQRAVDDVRKILPDLMIIKNWNP